MMRPKILIIMRGCPGSGKSYLASKLSRGGAVLAADDFWMDNGEYKFDPERINEAHLWNQARVIEAMKRNIWL